jgi:ferredoxin-type protein NapH
VSWIVSHRYWLARRTTQLGILLLFWLGAHRHLGVLTGDLSASHVFRTIPLADPFAVLQILATGHMLAGTVLLGAAVVLVIYVLVGGRSFCSWVCPVNLLTDFAAASKRRFQLEAQFRLPRGARYWILALALLVSAISGVAAFEWVSPIAVIHRELIFGAGLGLLVIVVILLFDLFIAKEGWCGSLCPLGAFYALVGRLSLVRVGFINDRCDRCGDCLVVCPEKQVIDFQPMTARGFIDSGECTNCTRCLEVCPRGAYHLTLRFARSAGRYIEEGDHHATQSAA